MLELSGVSIHFGGLRALDAVDARVAAGTIHGLIGPNGSGKTTLLNIVSGFYAPTAGRVRFAGEDLTGRPPHRIARKGIVRTFQTAALQDERTVLENVLLGVHCRLRLFAGDALLRRAWEEDRRRAETSLAFVHLEHLQQELVKNLPIGLRHLVEIARALAARPRLLLLDEPSTGLNPTETADLMKVIQRIRTEVAVLLVEHNMKVIMNICDRITVLDSGRKIADGTPLEIRRNPAVIESYLGRQAADHA
jgi:ABC-type branched-subunit amino acid transport system ATPase component